MKRAICRTATDSGGDDIFASGTPKCYPVPVLEKLLQHSFVGPFHELDICDEKSRSACSGNSPVFNGIGSRKTGCAPHVLRPSAKSCSAKRGGGFVDRPIHIPTFCQRPLLLRSGPDRRPHPRTDTGQSQLRCGLYLFHGSLGWAAPRQPGRFPPVLTAVSRYIVCPNADRISKIPFHSIILIYSWLKAVIGPRLIHLPAGGIELRPGSSVWLEKFQ